MGALLLAFVVGVFPASPFGEREVVHAQTGPALESLTVTITTTTPDDGKDVTPLSPTFDSKKTSYTMRASNAVERITVVADVEAGSGNSVGTITPADAETGTTDHQVDLSVGTTTIRIPVTSGGSLRTYTVAVTRVSSSASNDTKLSSLRLSNVTLSPDFDSDEAGYTDRVPNSVSLTTVTTRAANSGAMVSIRSAPNTFNTVTFGDTGMPADSANVVSLTGDNDDVDATTAIAIRVTAADVATKGYYTVVVTRAGANASSDAKLAATDNGLVVTGVSLSPSYDPDKTAYTASVPYLPSDIAFMATAADTGAMVMATSDMDDDTTDSDSNDAGQCIRWLSCLGSGRECHHDKG